MKIKYNNLYEQNKIIKHNIAPKLEELFINGDYINGTPTKLFENNFANYIGSKYAIGVSNGTDAIKLAVKSICDQNTLIITQANTFISTITGAIEGSVKARIELIDVDRFYQIDLNLLERFLQQNRNKYKQCIILGVHLYGHCFDAERMIELCNKYNAILIEDASQSHGTITKIGKTGSIGKIAAFSLYPGKNLGACGDAGIITTSDETVYNKLISLRNLGSIQKYHHTDFGYNHRLDSIQAIILNEKLKFLDEWNNNKQKIANRYTNEIKTVEVPKTAPYCLFHSYHIYCVQTDNRDKFITFLKNNEIETNIHYPIPVTDFKFLNCYGTCPTTQKNSTRIVSIPIHPFMNNDEIDYVVKTINSWKN